MSFRQRHPVLLGLGILAGIFLFFLGGISLLFSALIPGQRQNAFFGDKAGIGVIELKGMIVSPEESIATLTAFRRNRQVKAVLLRIDSPGGAVGASQEIYAEVKRTNRVKPVVASMGSVAASGGYYAALGATRILANPGTITGSIGVIAKFPNLEELFEKIGYRSDVVKSGELKDIGAPNRPMTSKERQLLQDLIDSTYRQFVSAIVESRALERQQVVALADGRIFSGQQALEHGLIDGLGNFTDAVTAAAELAGLEDTEFPFLIYPEPKGFSLFNLFTQGPDRFWGSVRQSYPAISYEWQGSF